jgi:hypothetical protein
MNAHDRADMIIKTIKLWQLVQHIDQGLEDGDDPTTTVVDSYFRRYGLTLPQLAEAGLLPLAQLKTTLAMMMVTLCFARTKVTADEWHNAGMIVRPEYDLRCKAPEQPTIDQVMRTLRNAAAHGFEDDGCVSFPEGSIVAFQSGSSRVVFRTARGFVMFLQDFMRAVQKVAIAQMSEQAT